LQPEFVSKPVPFDFQRVSLVQDYAPNPQKSWHQPIPRVVSSPALSIICVAIRAECADQFDISIEAFMVMKKIST